jgi:exopolysaccharide biosynthesis protein
MTLATVRDIADRHDLDIAVNANFFATQRTMLIAGRRVPYFAGNPARAAGWLVCDGRAISRAPAEASLVVDGRGRVRIGRFEKLPADAKHVVSGSQMLLAQGRITARGDVRAPRTAAGIDAAGTTLTLLVVDGRLLSHSVGMSELELAREMLRLGCSDALNLDGGGSSTLVMRKGDDGVLRVMNRPSDGHDLAIPLSLERNVACALGVWIDDGEAGEPSSQPASRALRTRR